ncbi:MAG: hypothetical protein ACQKBY_12375 [Verrucomicrobiales bacterium]
MRRLIFLLIGCLGCGLAAAAPKLHEDIFGKSLGGWDAKSGRAADYEVSGSEYRTWKPEVTPLLTGGMFISIRLDHLRGMFSSDDHASLEVTVDEHGNVISARSSLALQGKRLTSDLIRGTGKLGSKVAGLEHAAKIGADLVADLTSKVMKEKITEPGRVTFPAAIMHNYNLLCLAIGRSDDRAVPLDENGRPILPQGPTDPRPAQAEPVDPRKVVPLELK